MYFKPKTPSSFISQHNKNPVKLSRRGITRQPADINITYTVEHHNEQLILYVINYATYAYKVTVWITIPKNVHYTIGPQQSSLLPRAQYASSESTAKTMKFMEINNI